jgi:hypothetical protein
MIMVLFSQFPFPCVIFLLLRPFANVLMRSPAMDSSRWAGARPGRTAESTASFGWCPCPAPTTSAPWAWPPCRGVRLRRPRCCLRSCEPPAPRPGRQLPLSPPPAWNSSRGPIAAPFNLGLRYVWLNKSVENCDYRFCFFLCSSSALR